MAKNILPDDDGYDDPYDPNDDVDARDMGHKEVTEPHSKESDDGANSQTIDICKTVLQGQSPATKPHDSSDAPRRSPRRLRKR